MRQLLVSVVAIVLFSACSVTVTQMGPGRYMASKQGASIFASPSGLIADAMQKANEFCAEQEQYAVAENVVTVPDGRGIPNSQVVFRCMSEAEARQFQKEGGRWQTEITPPAPRTNINLYR